MSDVILTDFLLARIAEDEAVAKKAANLKIAGPLIKWHPDSAFLMRNDALEPVERAHIARHDPDRVLAECEAKRRIVELAWHDFGEEGDPYDDGIREGREMFRDPTLRLLALPHADHPDYDESWRP